MERKHIILIIIVAIVAIIAIGIVSANYLGVFSEKTNFETKFMNGTFQGNITENKMNNTNNSKYADWSASYVDKKNNITYNMSCVKNGSFIMDLYTLQGLAAPETRHFGQADWDIYYSQAVPTSNNNSTNVTENDTVNVYICKAEYNNTSYILNIIAYDDKAVDCDGSLYCELFTKHIQPLLESISFTQSKGAPKMNQILNISNDEFEQLSEYLEQAKNGNLTAANTTQ